MSDAMAVGTLYAARERGVQVPRDLSLVGFDDIAMASLAYPALTTISQPLQEMGRLAVTLLYRQISGQSLDANRVELSTKLVIRDSTASPT
jgi:LacI family transcriptional regulator